MRPALGRILLLAAGGLCAAAWSCRSVAEIPFAGFPLAVPHVPRRAPFDVLHYELSLELLPEERALRGECRVRMAGLSEAPALHEVRLDLVGLAVERVQDRRGRDLAFRRDPGGLCIELATPLDATGETELAITYSGRPERGLWFSGERATSGVPTQVFTHGQTEGSRGWFPCFDEPSERATSAITVRVPKEWVTVAAGERVGSRELDVQREEQWRMDFPHPAYLVTLVAGEFHVLEDRSGPVPLFFLGEERYSDHLAPTFAETHSILAFLADTTGIAYPYPKYSQAAVDNFPLGGMENISATTLTSLLLSDELGRRDLRPVVLIAHEAAHQWFGDFLTCADWSHLWLNEGFATYFSWLYLEHSRGEQEFLDAVWAGQETNLLEDESGRRPTISNVWKEPDDVFDTRPYAGAAVRLHLLRRTLGDQAFQNGIREYLTQNRGRSVVSVDLRFALEQASGRSLERFFDQWFAHAGFPEFALAWEWDADRGCARLAVEQIQEGLETPEVFEVGVDIELGLDPPQLVRVEVDERVEHFEWQLAERPEYLLFDRGSTVPKRVREEKDFDEWLALAEHCTDSHARRDAVLNLARWAGSAARRDAERARGALIRRLREDAAPLVRTAAAVALGQAGGAGAEDPLRAAALEERDVRARVAVLEALGSLGPDEGRASLAEDVFAEGQSYAVRAAAAALLCRADPPRAFEFVTRGLALPSPHDALAARLLGVLARLDDPRVVETLRACATDRSRAPTARVAAVEALAGLATQRSWSAHELAALLGEPSFSLRQAVVAALTTIGDASAQRSLAEYYPRSRTALERRWIESLLERSEL